MNIPIPIFYTRIARPTISNTVTIQTSKDKLYLTCLLGAMVAGMAFSLNNVGYLLGFNATTLALYGLVFTVTSLNWIVRAKPLDTQLAWCGLAAVPIFTRMAFNMPLFEEIVASVTDGQQVGYMAQVLGLWLLVAVCEEAFRATILNACIAWIPPTLGIRGLEIELTHQKTPEDWEDLTNTGKALVLTTATIAWLAFHFLQRPLNFALYWPYMIWLFVSGITMGYALVKAGMGAATVIHVITNLTD